MATTITGSPNIATLNEKIVADLCVGKFYIDLSPSVWIGSGASNVLGARVKITNPYGVVVKDWVGAYDIVPPMTSVYEYNIPTQSSNYQYGDYKIEIKLTDADSKEYTVSKTVSIVCIPSGKSKKYGTLSAQINGICKEGKTRIVVDTVPLYNGKTVTSSTQSFTLEYPTASALAPLTSTTGNFSVALYEGTHKLTGEVCASYGYGDNVFVKIKYKVNVLKDIHCGVDECLVLPKLAALNASLQTDCSEAEKQNTTSIILDALGLLKLIELGVACGQDVSDHVSELSGLLGLDVSDFGYVAGGSPAKDFLITGCNVEKTTVGLTDNYVINNYEYAVGVQDNGGVLTVAAATINGCIKTQSISFDITAAYNQIKNTVITNSTESLFWTSVVNHGLQTGGVNWTLLGLTASEVSNMTFSQLLNYLLNYVKSCCECKAVITAHSATETGGDVEIAWSGTGLFAIEVYVDMVLAATVLAPATSYTLHGLADNNSHTYTLIPKNSNGKSCTPVADSFEFFGCPSVNPPSVSTNTANGVACPYNLTLLVASLPLGQTAEWHTANNTLPSTLVGNPAAVSSGVYFVFAKSGTGCYSTGVAVTVVCEAPISCTEPQNLMVTSIIGGYLVSFQSAANPPATYLVRRRLKVDPDINGSYTNIGTPSWNATTNRWEILDTTATNNTLYTYRAVSQCANSTTPHIDFDFANLTCPAVTITPAETAIAYSFTHAGNAVDKYEISLYNSTGLVNLHTDTRVPAFTTPVSGSFTGLPSSVVETSYKVRIRMFIGTYYKDCLFTDTHTLAINACPAVTGIGGAGFGGTA